MLASRMVVGTLLISLGLWPSQASAGWVIDQVVKATGTPQQVVIEDNRMKITTMGKDGKPANAAVIDAGAQTFTQIDYGEKQYISASTEEYARMIQGAQKALAPKMAEVQQKMQEKMKNMPPEQRKLLEQKLNAQMGNLFQDPKDCPEPPKVELRKTEQQETIAGFKTVRYDLMSNGKIDAEIWVAKEIAVGEDLDPQKMQQFTAEMTKLIPCGGGQGKNGPLGNDPVWKVAREGYPVRTVDHSSGKEAKPMVEVVKAEQKTVPATEFQPPTGFTRKELPHAAAKP